ncbi:Head fiber protein [Robertmurraya sp. FSL R5-0851]|uniref:Head fiber protein n=1 Tax=Robertmurraya sp. FSL R5-0851 TaxID=2921584 RepID=UPI001D71CAAE
MSNVKNYTEQGGEKTIIGGTLEIVPGGKLLFDGTEVNPADNQVNSTAADVAGLVTDFNSLLAKLNAAGLMKSE